MKRRTVVGFFITSLALSVAGCGNAAGQVGSVGSQQAEAAGNESTTNGSTAAVTQTVPQTTETAEPTRIHIAYATSAYPAAYQDEKGNDTGYSVEVMKLVDEALAQYEFDYEVVDGDAVMTGLSTGQYDIAIGSYVYTEERAQAFILPEQILGIQVFGIAVKNENADVRSLGDAAEKGLVFTPLRPSDARYSIVNDYNEANPDKAINLQASDNYESLIEQIAGVAEGRYGFAIAPFHAYNSNIIEETGEYHDTYNDIITLNLFTGVPHYTMVNPNEGELADVIGEQLGLLREDGILARLSNEWYGFDQFDYYSDDLTN